MKQVRYCGVVIKRRQLPNVSFTTRGNGLHSDEAIRKIVTLDLGIKLTFPFIQINTNNLHTSCLIFCLFVVNFREGLSETFRYTKLGRH